MIFDQGQAHFSTIPLEGTFSECGGLHLGYNSQDDNSDATLIENGVLASQKVKYSYQFPTFLGTVELCKYQESIL